MRSPRGAVISVAMAAVLIGLSACTSAGGSSSGTGSVAAGRSAAGRSAAGSHSGAVSATSAEVSFDADGTTTYGTLEVPAHRAGQLLAAALLIPGSGTVDRDGNVASQGVTPATLKVIAGILSKQGIMTLRFDKYFTGKTGGGRYAADPGTATIDNDLRQAAAAYDFLGHQPSADPEKLLVVGHSEGGMFALDIAATDATKPAGLALLEPQDLRILDLFRIQTDEYISSLAAQGQLTDAQARSNATAAAAAINDFRAGQPVRTAGLAASVVQFVTPLILSASNERYARTWDAIVPADLAGRVQRGTRVLVTEGTRDTNVPPNTIGPLTRGLSTAGTTGPGLTVVAGTDHDMHLATQPDNDAVLAPAEITAIQGWAQPYAS